ncbi:hypothetical protein GUJ93_ZPchr0006g41253 [Zizania palustris]|uniref:Uncharacterized protein n=1 Tax=Zizania palustris TaxID=103762 RepID=A0A8J5VWB7_ZIZPA|nr:hypothetical protein GUJ93_ZPchr0006g41253 [Zizania palustris]
MGMVRRHHVADRVGATGGWPMTWALQSDGVGQVGGDDFGARGRAGVVATGKTSDSGRHSGNGRANVTVTQERMARQRSVASATARQHA